MTVSCTTVESNVKSLALARPCYSWPWSQTASRLPQGQAPVAACLHLKPAIKEHHYCCMIAHILWLCNALSSASVVPPPLPPSAPYLRVVHQLAPQLALEVRARLCMWGGEGRVAGRDERRCKRPGLTCSRRLTGQAARSTRRDARSMRRDRGAA